MECPWPKLRPGSERTRLSWLRLLLLRRQPTSLNSFHRVLFSPRFLVMPGSTTWRWSIRNQTQFAGVGGQLACPLTCVVHLPRSFTAPTSKCHLGATIQLFSQFMTFPGCCILTRMQRVLWFAAGCDCH